MIPGVHRQAHPMPAAQTCGHQQTGYMAVQAIFVLASEERSCMTVFYTRERLKGAFRMTHSIDAASIYVDTRLFTHSETRDRGCETLAVRVRRKPQA
jgi:hypothetical protein